MRTLFAAAVLAVVAVMSLPAASQIPIPPRPLGIAQGALDAPVVLETFMDQLCPDSAVAWPTMLQVLNHYGKDKLRLLFHVFPLPYHHNSYFASMGLKYLQAQGNESATLDWISLVFKNRAQFLPPTTPSMTAEQVQASYGKLAATLGIDGADFTAALSNRTYDLDLRTAWKYACTRAVAETPTFMVNGVVVAGEATWTLSDWEIVLDPIYQESGLPLPHKAGCQPRADVPPVTANTTCPSGEKKCTYLPGKYECCLKGEWCVPNVGCRC
eukprot:PLAT493.1.p2 GENE.PLAT493.1~~PLAT493.1.p2  ORF type:complete len:270 (-),score=119.25 PLAT493.1:264-1073(-)